VSPIKGQIAVEKIFEKRGTRLGEEGAVKMQEKSHEKKNCKWPYPVESGTMAKFEGW